LVPQGCGKEIHLVFATDTLDGVTTPVTFEFGEEAPPPPQAESNNAQAIEPITSFAIDES